MGIYRGEFTPGNPVFPAGSAALCKEAAGPVDILAPDITYTAEDEKALETYNRNFGKSRGLMHTGGYLSSLYRTVQTTWHSVSSVSSFAYGCDV
jgi:hypothetical protein